MFRVSLLLYRFRIDHKFLSNKKILIDLTKVQHHSAISTWTRNFEVSRILSAHQIQQSCLLNNHITWKTNKQNLALTINTGKYRFSTSNNNDTEDDLQAILKDKSIGFIEKFKILFKQYGMVLVVVHCVTAAIWIAIFYIAVSRGIDIIPLLEKYGVLDFMEKIPYMPSKESLKNSGAKDWVLVYLIYEILKPVRYIVTIFGTAFAVRYLRRLGYMKRPPKLKENQVRDMITASNKLARHRVDITRKKYSSKYKNSREKYSSKFKQMRSRRSYKSTNGSKNKPNGN